jgi:hypothetical protein
MRIVLVFHEQLVNRLRCLRWLLRIRSTGLGNERDPAQGDGRKASDESKLHPDPPNCIDEHCTHEDRVVGETDSRGCLGQKADGVGEQFRVGATRSGSARLQDTHDSRICRATTAMTLCSILY